MEEPEGQIWQTREYAEHGTDWHEQIYGDNHFRHQVPRTMAQRARAEGTHRIGDTIIHGHATPQQLERIRIALQKLPENMRQHAREIFLTDNLGVIYPEEPMWGLSGLADYPGGIFLDRIALQGQSRFEALFYHEMGHNADLANGKLSNRPPWGSGAASSPYGGRNGMEDFAEIHSLVLQNLHDLSSLLRTHPELAQKIQEIMRLYALHTPSSAPPTPRPAVGSHTRNVPVS